MSQQPKDNTNQILETTEKIVESVTKPEVVEIVEVVGKTTENIFSILVTSGDKPTAIILAIAILVAALAIPIIAVNFSPSQINQPVESSHLNQDIQDSRINRI